MNSQNPEVNLPQLVIGYLILFVLLAGLTTWLGNSLLEAAGVGQSLNFITSIKLVALIKLLKAI